MAKAKLLSLGEQKKLSNDLIVANKQIAHYQELLAADHPKEILNSIPITLEQYSPSLCDKVLALGHVGFSPASIMAQTGITKDNWHLWKKTHSEFNTAVSRALTLSRAHWHNRSRVAMNENNWQFQTDKVERMLATQFVDDDDGLVDYGDASTLVLLDISAKKSKKLSK